MSAVTELARAVGLQPEWDDAQARPQVTAEDDLARVLAALGYPAGSEAEIAASHEKLAAERAARNFLSVDLGDDLLINDVGMAKAEVMLEDGGGMILPLTAYGSGQLRLPTSRITTPGYHQLQVGGRDYTLAVAPRRCFSFADAAPGRRLWGSAAQIASLVDDRPSAFGDFGTLAGAAAALGQAGADALAISPAHALFPADPSRFSPYAPSSRLFLNILYADPRLVGGTLPGGAGGELIDWAEAIPARIAALRAAYDARSDAVRQQVAAFEAKGGQELRLHATFDALHAHFFATGAGGWQGWPPEFHDAQGTAVQRFADEHAEEIGFYLFAQWLAEGSLAAAQGAAKQAGMAIGLIADLAVGMDGGGSHAWSRPDDLLTGLSIGAPPDLLGPQGQDWGITSFAPMALQRTGFAGFIGTVRSAITHAGGIRIDHILGLNRLWLVPHGVPSKQGAYITYPLDDYLRILAIESHRARAVVIGEDLGTVPEGLRPRLAARAVHGMNVLWFEREDDGAFIPPADYRASSVAMTGTHDLATVAGWWKGRDVDWAWRLGRSRADSKDDDLHERQRDRAQLWEAIRQTGSAHGPCPADWDRDPVVDAAAAHIGTASAELVILPLEDLVGLDEQPNLPGTIDEHPNWRRRLPAPVPDLLASPQIASRARRIGAARKGNPA
ncbi:4-alpha-glucanotransferase [Croceibacterium mercuriale]|uniref:4-alpha-glucanotransferase n=1 Tax=Croceibacterium mercuriale TaxID=1572751 RepID=A0A0B2BYG4_9SPHN|nr:4-alpha-glucanotransferase [Croceibacterium mercuriale]KHL24875.1 4-alpha-glucanotransferase [Croceibacterium mercuriale]